MSRRSYVHLVLIGTAVLVFAFTSPVRAELYINEIAWDCGGNSDGGAHLAGSDNRDEYIEIRGTPGMSLANHYLIFIEAEDNDTHTGGAGLVENIFDLGGSSMGSNGFLTLRQKGNLYDTFFNGVAAGTTDLVNTGSGIGWGNDATSSVGHTAELNKTTIENSGWTAMIIRNNGDPVAARPTIGLDVDVDNNGLDPVNMTNPHHWAANWTIIDSIGLFTEGAEPFYGRTYAPTTFGTMQIGDEFFPGGPKFLTPNIEPGGTYVFAPWAHTESEIEYLARWGNSTGQTPDDWHIVNVTQRTVAGSANGAPDYRVSGEPHPGSITDPPPPGQVVETNKGVPYRTALFNTLGQPNYPVIVDGSLPGDFNEDGTVNAADYVVWRNNLGVVPAKLANETASLGVVDQDDYNVWKSQFGQTLPGISFGAGSSSNIPEPGCLFLATFTLFAAPLALRWRES